MKRKTIFPRLGALLLTATLLLSPAQAITVDQARELLDTVYVDPIDQAVLDLPTVDQILNALGDPYTEHLTAQEYDYFLSTMADYTLGGVGFTSLLTDIPLDQGLLVEEVLEGYPAQKAGIRAGDIIVAVDGVSLAGMASNEAMALISGEPGTQVVLTYLRQNRRRTVTLTRTTIVIPSTDGQVLEGEVGYIACDTWGEETVGHFRQLIEKMEDQVGCWLVDLRGNGGGLTDAAVEAAGLFCGRGTMAYLRTRGNGPGGYGYEFYDSNQSAMTDKPVVVLVDGGTASASEVFTAALRDYGRAVIVGERTFGKGISQGLWDREILPDYFPDGDCMKITFARVYSPLGTTSHIMGVIPHLPAGYDQAPELALELSQAMAQAGWDWPNTAQRYIDRLVAREGGFEDTSDHLFEDSIATLAAYELVRGKDDGLYHPEDTLTRSELAQMFQNVLDYYPGTGSEDFSDVPADAWYAPAVDAVASLGLMNGTGEGLFSPDRVLTRQELFAVVGRLGQYLNDDLNFALLTAEGWQLDRFALRNYADWAQDPVWLLSRGMEDEHGELVNLLWENPEFIDPGAPATRAEAAEVLCNLLSYLNILP